MRVGLALLLGWMLLAPVSASALNPNECAQLLKQIHHYDGMYERAESMGNEMWSSRMQMQTDLLRERYDQRCAGFVDDDRAMRAFLEGLGAALKVGAKAAAKFFTMGAF